MRRAFSALVVLLRSYGDAAFTPVHSVTAYRSLRSREALEEAVRSLEERTSAIESEISRIRHEQSRHESPDSEPPAISAAEEQREDIATEKIEPEAVSAAEGHLKDFVKEKSEPAVVSDAERQSEDLVTETSETSAAAVGRSKELDFFEEARSILIAQLAEEDAAVRNATANHLRDLTVDQLEAFQALQSSNGSLTLQERQAFMATVAICGDWDQLLLSFLRPVKFDAERAVAAMQQCRDFRAEHDLDNLFLRRLPAKKLRKHRRHWPLGFVGVDKEGSPVLYDRVGSADIVGLSSGDAALDFDNLLQLYLQNMEVRRRWLFPRLSRQAGRPIVQMATVLDLAGLSWRQVPQGLRYVRKVGEYFRSGYSDVVKAVYVVNAPRLFSRVWSGLQKVLGEDILGKVRILGSGEDALQGLATAISRDQIPDFLGGQMATNLGVSDPMWAKMDVAIAAIAEERSPFITEEEVRLLAEELERKHAQESAQGRENEACEAAAAVAAGEQGPKAHAERQESSTAASEGSAGAAAAAQDTGGGPSNADDAESNVLAPAEPEAAELEQVEERSGDGSSDGSSSSGSSSSSSGDASSEYGSDTETESDDFSESESSQSSSYDDSDEQSLSSADESEESAVSPAAARRRPSKPRRFEPEKDAAGSSFGSTLAVLQELLWNALKSCVACGLSALRKLLEMLGGALGLQLRKPGENWRAQWRRGVLRIGKLARGLLTLLAAF